MSVSSICTHNAYIFMIKSKYTIAVVVTILCVVLGYLAYASFEPPFDLAGGCAETSSTETLAPAKAAIAKEAVVNCGATSDYATQVTIKDPKTGASGLVLSM